MESTLLQLEQTLTVLKGLIKKGVPDFIHIKEIKTDITPIDGIRYNKAILSIGEISFYALIPVLEEKDKYGTIFISSDIVPLQVYALNNPYTYDKFHEIITTMLKDISSYVSRINKSRIDQFNKKRNICVHCGEVIDKDKGDGEGIFNNECYHEPCLYKVIENL